MLSHAWMDIYIKTPSAQMKSTALFNLYRQLRSPKSCYRYRYRRRDHQSSLVYLNMSTINRNNVQNLSVRLNSFLSVLNNEHAVMASKNWPRMEQ